MDTNGRVAVITGGASGIGRGIARAFAGEGMRLVLADLDEQMLAATVDELPAAAPRSSASAATSPTWHQVEALATAALDAFGAVHVLCNNAGVGIPTPTHNIRLEDWRWIVDVDLWGPIYGVKTFLPIMEGQGDGHLNTTASVAGLIAGAFIGAYNVAKHGAVALMTTLERDLRAAEPRCTPPCCARPDQHRHRRTR